MMNIGGLEYSRERTVRLPKVATAERRGRTRFPLALEVRYALSGGVRQQATGSGRSINLSSSGMNFTVDWPLRTREKLDLSIDWPARLDGGAKLQLLISGLVVRTHGTTAALQIRRYEFRTRCEA